MSRCPRNGQGWGCLFPLLQETISPARTISPALTIFPCNRLPLQETISPCKDPLLLPQIWVAAAAREWGASSPPCPGTPSPSGIVQRGRSPLSHPDPPWSQRGLTPLPCWEGGRRRRWGWRGGAGGGRAAKPLDRWTAETVAPRPAGAQSRSSELAGKRAKFSCFPRCQLCSPAPSSRRGRRAAGLAPSSALSLPGGTDDGTPQHPFLGVPGQGARGSSGCRVVLHARRRATAGAVGCFAPAW